MYINNLKRLRNEKEMTQEDIAKKLKCSRSTYNNWERGIVMIPLDIADQLSVFYKADLTCVLGINKKLEYNLNIKKMNYNKLLKNLSSLKDKHKNTYEEIATYLKCNSSTCQRYFKGEFKIPIDRLILLSELYEINIDELCGKK